MVKKHSILPAWLAPFGALLVFVYLLVSLTQNQAAIRDKQRELDEMQRQLTTQEALNQELSRSLADGEDEFIERIAREQGYAQPNERIFIGY